MERAHSQKVGTLKGIAGLARRSSGLLGAAAAPFSLIISRLMFSEERFPQEVFIHLDAFRKSDNNGTKPLLGSLSGDSIFIIPSMPLSDDAQLIVR